MKFAIWHKDPSFTSAPEFEGSEKQVVRQWLKTYHGGTISLDYKITPADPARRWELWEIVEGGLENFTPPEG